jgi:hypothetical protein
MSGWTAALLLFTAFVLGPIESYAQLLIPKPDEPCQVCTVTNMSQRTRYYDGIEEWYVGCVGCRGPYEKWTIQGTFQCFPWHLREPSWNPE